MVRLFNPFHARSLMAAVVLGLAACIAATAGPGTADASGTVVIGGCKFGSNGTTLVLGRDCTATGTILLPPAVTLDGNGHTIYADANGNWPTRALVVAPPGSVADIVDVRLDVTATAPGAIVYIVYFAEASGSIRDSTIVMHPAGGVAVVVAGGPGVVIENNTAAGPGYGVAATGAPVEIIGNSFTSMDVGISVQNASAVTIRDNTISAKRGVDIANGSQAFGTRLKVYENSISASVAGVILMTSCNSVPTKDASIWRNEIRFVKSASNGGYGVWLEGCQGSLDGTAVDSNTFAGGWPINIVHRGDTNTAVSNNVIVP